MEVIDMLTKGAIGNLINRYRAVLKKCHLMNTFGSLAVASMLVMGAAGAAMGAVAQIGNNPYDSLAAAVDAAQSGDTIVLLQDVQGSGVKIDTAQKTDITIDLGGHEYTVVNPTVGSTGTETNGFQLLKGGELTIKNGTITAGTDSAKILIQKYCDLTLDHVTLNAREGTTDYTLSNNNGTTTVINGSVINASKNGFALDAYDWPKNGYGNVSVVVDGSSVNGRIEMETDGTAWSDGRTHELTLKNTEISNQSTTGNGGAIKINSSTASASIDNVAFNNNTAASGGAIWNKGQVELSDASFTGNTASSQGGAIFNQGNMTVGATFTGNKASQGGAIMNYGGTGTSLTVTDGSIFRNNEASSVGGAISHVDAGNMVIGNDVLFENNVSVAGQGGALHNQRATTEIGNDAKFINNVAKGYGGGAIYQDTDSTASSVTIGSNAEFIGNETETSHGGAIMNFNGGNGAGMTIGDGATFDSNKAGKTGGAISNWGGKMALADATFTNNTAATNGGAIYNDTYYKDDSSFTISGSTFTGNSAEEEGGAIYNAGTMTLSGDNTFSDNTAAGKANDIHNAGALTVADGVTKLNSGYTQEGASASLNVNTGASLAVAMPDMGGMTASSDEALLALGKQLNVGEGRLRIGSVSDANDADVAFGNNSLLVVDGKAANAGALITGSGDISVDGGSKLYIANAKAGEAYTITSGLATAEGEYWKSANLLAGRLMEAAISTDGDKIVVETEGKNVANVLPGIIPVAGINTMIADNLNDTDSSSAGIRFLSRAMDNVRYMPSDNDATGMVNEVSRASVTAGVQNTALRLADAAADQLAHHLSLSFFGKENNIHKDGVDIWATPMYGNTYTHGMVASGAAVRGNYGGVTLGADAKVGEILGGKVRVGASVNGGGGKSETRGTVTSTDNEYNFGGVNLYAGWNLDNLNVMASVGYAMGNHDVKMNLPASMGMGQAKADIDTNAFIADLRAEYQINTSVVDILPHAGVRYTALNTESHDLKVNGSTLNSVASDTQHIVQFPIGVTVSKDIDVAGWNVKPQADVSVIPAAGEKKNTTKVSYAGIGALDSVNTRIMDSTSWAGMVGVQAEKGNFALGLNYGVQASSHETDQSVSVGISWKF